MPTFQDQITFLYTRDLDATAHFYENMLGLPLDRAQPDCKIYKVTDHAYVGFCQREVEPSTDTLIMCLITDDVDGWYESLKAKGVPFEKAPARNPKYNIYHCFVRDPNGYLVEIQKFLD
jgi:catechol 2,3-dioxygenase-like lactoylglutathione lyase family enzyme